VLQQASEPHSHCIGIRPPIDRHADVGVLSESRYDLNQVCISQYGKQQAMGIRERLMAA
jgi:hypothetical protein